MASTTTTYPLVNSWSSSARYTAGAETPVRVSNPNDHTAIKIVVTDGDTTPTDDPAGVNTILPGQNTTITLATGERLWMLGQTGFAALEV